MPFKLPNGRDLSPEQIETINLPTNKDYMITGSPGTGKTVMAIYRAGQIARYYSVLMLVYNAPLKAYLSTAIKEQISGNCEINTYNSWISHIYRDYLGMRAPTISELDWDSIYSDFLPLGKLYEHVVIDEAQDFPIGLIRVLKAVANHITCFVDTNQAIEPGKTDQCEILRQLCIESDFELTKNFRNTKEISDVARLFWNGDNDFAHPLFSSGHKPVAHKCTDFDDQTALILNLIEQNLELEIGIIDNNKSENKRYESIRDGLKRAGYSVDVQMYKSKSEHAIDFEQTGVKIVSYGTMKGLEFDMVILPMFDKIKSTGDLKADKNRVYVALTRACRDLHLTYFNTYSGYDRIDTMSKLLKNRELLEWR